jgi:hypothetical protein
VKNNRIIDIAERRIRSRSPTLAGRIHDKRICDEEAYTFPPGCVLLKDPGFQGCEPENVCTYQPKKKPRNHALSTEEKAEHQRISSIRILVEHGIGSVKRGRIVHEVLRNTKAHFDDLVMEIACGLHNFRPTLRSTMLESVS